MKKYLYLCSVTLLFLGIFISHNVLADGIDSSAHTGKITGSLNIPYSALGGVDISLRDSGGNVIDRVKSDDEGKYVFENVPEGTGYSISGSDYYIISSDPQSIDNIIVSAGETTVVEQRLSFITMGGPGLQALLDPVIRIKPAWGYEGGKVAVNIYADNIEGIYMEGNEKLIGFRLCIYYDSKLLTPISIENGMLLGNDELSYVFLSDNLSENDNACVTAEWMGDEPVDSDDTLFTINFRINTGIMDGSLANIHIDENSSVVIFKSLEERAVITGDTDVVIKTLQNDPYDAETVITQNGLERNNDSVSGSIDCDIIGALSDNNNMVAIIAVYSNDGILFYCQSKEILKPNGDKSSVVFDGIDIKTNTNECIVKIFCWEKDNCIPIARSVSFRL
ncbi:MAG: cohesin domain-containing protein [Candidatus Ornithomonoglobus sp.]